MPRRVKCIETESRIVVAEGRSEWGLVLNGDWISVWEGEVLEADGGDCCCSSVTKMCPTLSDPMNCSTSGSLSFTPGNWGLLKFMSTESVMPSKHLILYRLFLLPSVFPSIKVFSNESALHIRYPKYWSFSLWIFISPSNKYSGLISFRIDWFDLLAVQRTLKRFFQHHSSKEKIHWRLDDGDSCTIMEMYWMPLKCALRMVKMVNCTLYAFYYNLKTCSGCSPKERHFVCLLKAFLPPPSCPTHLLPLSGSPCQLALTCVISHLCW